MILLINKFPRRKLKAHILVLVQIHIYYMPGTMYDTRLQDGYDE